MKRLWYKLYSDDQLHQAVSAVKQKRLSITKASREFGIPITTIGDYVRGRSVFDKKPGRSLELTKEEEKSLVNIIKHLADHGFSMSRTMIRCYIRDIVRKSGRKTRLNLTNGPSDEWFRHFFCRFPESSERRPENMDAGRTRMSNGEVMEKWFTFLDGVLSKYGIKDMPDRIYSCDETGWTGKESARAKVSRRKNDHIFRQKTAVSSHLCVCADGRFLPSMIIFQGSLPHRNFKDGIPSAWYYGTSESGYMDGELFLKWFQSCFLPNCVRERPVCLIMDNHDSHLTLPLVEMAIENNVILVGLPAHATHILQPLDVKIIAPLKGRVATLADSFSFLNGNFTDSKAMFPVLLHYAIDQTTPATVREAFEATGICPLNGNFIDKSQLVPASFKPQAAQQQTVTISSDEEESMDSNKSQTHSAPPTPSRSPSHAGDQQECPESPLIPNIPLTLKRGEKTRVKKMEDAEGATVHEKSPSPTRVTLNARTVRVGTFRGAPVEPILVSENGLSFYIEGVTGTHAFNLYPQEIQQCLAKFDSDPNLIFFLTSHNCALRTRKDLGMVLHADPAKPVPEHYFDPSGAEMRHQMITIVMDQLSLETRQEFQKYMELFKSWGKQGDEAFFMELSKVEADEIFRQSTTVQRVNQVVAQTSLVPDHGYSQAEEDRQSDCSPSPKIGFVGPIIKLLTYPPPPAKGGISITNEDLYCLQEGEFLNDVIIDFYLKYLLREKLSQVDHDRTHIFSSFFYKRLTQRIRGAAIDDDPNVSLAVKRHARVKTWTRKLDLFSKDFIVIPINEHAHWFLAIICFPGLEKPVENPYIPNPVSTPSVDSSSCPTPPQPSDDGADEMETEENEDPLAEVVENNTKDEKTDENGTSGDIGKEKTESQSMTDDFKPENQSDKDNSENCDESESEKKETQSEKAESQTEEGKEGEALNESPVEKSESVQGDTVVKQTRSMKTLMKSIRGKAVGPGEEATAETVSGIKQPCIIIFDSLSGPSRSRIVTVLKEYLQVEWAVKKGGELNKTSIKGCVPKVPQQNNFSDCGVFMLQYVESFFEDPVQDFSTPIKGLHDWFTSEKIEGKREELRDLIIELKEKYESKAEENNT